MPSEELVKAELTIGSERVRLELLFSSVKAQAVQLLPMLQALADQVVAVGVRESEAKGREISCRKGCGACCAQLVPLSEPEAIYLLQLIDSMPGDRQRVVRERFSRNRRLVEEAGLLDEVITSVSVDGRKVRREVGLGYFRLGLPCPFLEQEACSIHPHRPLSCREYLVVSAPEECAQPELGGVEKLVFPRTLSPILYAFGDGEGNDKSRVVPLALLLDWGEAHPPGGGQLFEPARYVENFLRKLADSS